VRRNCGHCGAFLPPFAPKGEKFCGEQCRVWAQQKREALSGPNVLALAELRRHVQRQREGKGEPVAVVEAEPQLPGLQVRPKPLAERPWFRVPTLYLPATPPGREGIYSDPIFDGPPRYLPATRPGTYGEPGEGLELYRQALALLTWEREVLESFQGYDWRPGEYISIDELD
jgi:hypothetical protein